MTENSFSQDSLAFDVVLTQTIARHFRGATTEAIDDVQTVRLGEGLPTIECFIDETQDHEPYGAFLFLQISGGAFGSRSVLVTASGYGSNQLESVVTAGCTWACAFGPVLLTGIGRPDLIDSDNPDIELFETTVGGRRYRVATGHLDRSMNMPIEEVEAYRQRLGGPRALTDRVLASPLIPATRSDDAVALGCYAAIGPHSITELKFAGAEWRMSPYDGSVWLDSRACDDGFTRVAPNFISWYEAWLDHAIRGGGSFAQWSYQVDAAYKMLEQSSAEFGVERLPETVTRVKIQTPTKAFGPCHACQLVYSRCGVPESVFVTAPSPAP